MAYTVFISHDSSDEEWAVEIANNIIMKVEGAEYYLYQFDKQPGESLNDKIKQQIMNSDLMIVLITPNSSRSPDVQQEIGYAEDKTPIVPVVHQNVHIDDLGFILQGREYLDLNPRSPEQTLVNIMRYVQEQKQIKRQKRNRALVILGAVAVTLLAGGGEG